MNSKPRTIKVAFVAVLLSFMLLLGASAFAQSPAAGTTIGNQASATYTDGSAVQRTATSNLVVTTVQQVAAFTLTANNAKTATPGAQVVYTHTLTNTGNGADNFNIGLTSAGAAANTNLSVFIDANNDGVPDNSVNLVGGTVPLAAGASVHVLVVGTVPASATSGQTGTMTISTSSVFDNTIAAVSNTDTTTVTGNAVVNLTKSLSAVSGASPSGAYTVTLTYTNNGNATATNVQIGDTLPAGMNYVANSGRWSVTGATVLTDATGDVQPASGSPNINYSIDGTSRIITAIISSVPAQTSGTVTFQVNIASGLVPGPINNIATIQYNDGTSNVGPFNSNIATFTVNQAAGVTLKDTGSSATGDSDNSQNFIQLVASATQGGTVTFRNVVTNTGNGTDTFNITLSSSTFPAGTTFVLYKSDGVTPLTDSNGDGVADTGPLAKTATYDVYVKATLPAGALGGPYNVTATATSVFSSAATASVTEQLTTIIANTVDLTNNSPAGAGVPGNGVFPSGEASAQINNNVNPGATTVFTLYVNNTSATADSYDLLVSTSTSFSGNTLPAGWTIAFQNSGNSTDCSSLGSTITNTGVVNATGNKLVCAVIGVPSGYAAGAQQIYFRALSSTSGAVDVLHDSVTVSTVHSVTLTPNNTGQIFPGGSVVYVHTLKNNGNVTETVNFSGTWIGDNQSLWSSTLYTDNGPQSNQLDATDTPVSSGSNNSFSLAPGETKVMLVKVIAPPAAAAGAVDTTTVTATYNGGASTANANDQSTVIAGDLRLNKLQATSSACNGTPDATFAAAALSAKPGACLVYQITAENQGTANVTTVVLSDATPTNTTYFDNSGAFPAKTTVGTITNPVSGSAGTIKADVGTLTPGQSAVITFMVKIN